MWPDVLFTVKHLTDDKRRWVGLFNFLSDKKKKVGKNFITILHDFNKLSIIVLCITKYYNH